MGEAKQRGTRDERIAAAPARAEKPERTYRYMTPIGTCALDQLWNKFKIGKNDETVEEIIAQAKAFQEAAKAARETRALAEAKATLTSFEAPDAM